MLESIRIDDIDPSLVLNLDETGFGEMEKRKVFTKIAIVPKNIQNTINFVLPRDSSHVSVIS